MAYMEQLHKLHVLMPTIIGPTFTLVYNDFAYKRQIDISLVPAIKEYESLMLLLNSHLYWSDDPVMQFVIYMYKCSINTHHPEYLRSSKHKYLAAIQESLIFKQHPEMIKHLGR